MTRGEQLSRQISHYLASDTAEAELTALFRELQAAFNAGDLSPALAKAYQAAAEAFSRLPVLFGIVEETYLEYQGSLKLAERNASLTTEEMMQANRAINAMVNCLGQGFLIFDRNGICTQVYSKACETLLETTPAGKRITEVLQLSEAQQTNFEFLLGMAFDGAAAMSFDEIMRLAPRQFIHSQGLNIQLDYKPEMNGDQLSRIVLVVSDITRENEARQLAEERRVAFEALERILQDRPGFGTYMRHVAELPDVLAETTPETDWIILRREIHTLKAGAGMFRLFRLTKLLHELETVLIGGDGPDPAIDLSDVAEQRERLVAEIARITRRVREVLGLELAALEYETRTDKATLYDFARYLQNAGQTELVREYLRRVCAEPLWSCLHPLDVLVMDLADRFNKKIQPIRFAGENVPIIRELYHSFFAVLTHLFRNIADHGIEDTHTRLRLNKPEAGVIEVTTALDKAGERLSFRISDDGVGIDVAALRAKLMTSDPAGNWQQRDDNTVTNSLLVNSISTRDSISHYSGRGLGVSAVYHEVIKLDGSMSIQSIPGQGTSFLIEIPYRLELP